MSALDSQSDIEHVVVSVPEEHIGHVIGSKGAGLGRLRSECGVKTNVPREHISPGMRCIEVSGTAAQVLNAQAVISSMIEIAQNGQSAGRKRKATDDQDGPVPYRSRLLHDASPAMGPSAGYLLQNPQNFLMPDGQYAPQLGWPSGPAFHHAQQPIASQQAMQGFPQVLPFLPQQLPPLLQPTPHSGDAHPTAKLLIEANKAGVVVGKQGATLKAIRQETGAKIEVAREPVLGLRLVIIKAPMAGLEGSLSMICALIGDGPPIGSGLPDLQAAGAPKASLKLLFASNLAGSIIGKGGTGLAELRQYGIKAELARDEVLLAERMLAVEGPPIGVCNAICVALRKMHAPMAWQAKP
uniref:K Homology domain-containing protein n=1 Tax=Prymnesium polylepis TaxID=72548 RepID=A0A6V4AU19_9EUKA|mmetsp:Transcript_9000/g.21624  ORF Transcript_9000/g.21624 Transcript_9000/m.21624 type:complete len:354 (+) Transcript_9000:33-1094(+)